jgi:hypothetical protein
MGRLRGGLQAVARGVSVSATARVLKSRSTRRHGVLAVRWTPWRTPRSTLREGSLRDRFRVCAASMLRGCAAQERVSSLMLHARAGRCELRDVDEWQMKRLTEPSCTTPSIGFSPTARTVWRYS